MLQAKDGEPLTFADHGAQRFRGAILRERSDLSGVLDALPRDRAGIRIHGVEPLRRFLTPDGPIGSVASAVLGPESRAVRAVLFDKTPDTNWSLGWHQDRTICVRHRCPVDGFGPWTVKDGMVHVAPPFELLTRMVTIRAHLDDVPADNAPLLIVPGSHRIGRVAVTAIDDVVRRLGTRACRAKAGDVWLYATPIVHASAAAERPGRRRVLQIDFAGEALPGGLEWLSV